MNKGPLQTFNGVCLAFDVGLASIGTALFIKRKLVLSWLQESNPTKARGPDAWKHAARTYQDYGLCPDSIVIETMKIYKPQDIRKVIDARDILELQGIAGALANQWPDSIAYGVEPGGWKGQIKKQTMTNLIRATVKAYDWDSKIVLPSANELAHNVYDAVGLGIWAHGLPFRAR